MAKDILVFKNGEVNQIESKSAFPGSLHHPTRDEQAQRMGPRFAALQAATEKNQFTFQQEAENIDPEYVLVFEVAGEVDGFVKAAQRAGMEWLGSEDNYEDPDEFFYEPNKDGKPSERKITGKFYLTMTNTKSRQQLLSLWKIYTDNKDKFPKGCAPFREVFNYLRDVRLWNEKNRFEDTGMKTYLNRLLESNVNNVRFEIELWYRNDEKQRTKARNSIQKIIEQYGGSLIRESIRGEIGYHGIICEFPSEGVRNMLQNPDQSLVNADQIMWMRPSAQIAAPLDLEEIVETVHNETPLPEEDPVIALIDGLPLQNHALLQERLIIDDPDGYEENYIVNSRKHATSMASLIIYGSLDNPYPPLTSKLYVRPILKPNSEGNETIPDDVLFTDALYEAISSIGNSSIRIVNLSIGNLYRPFLYTMSPEAKMLDYLSEKYGLLIIVSAGNIPQDIELDMNFGDLHNISEREKAKAVYDYIWNNQVDMRILSPSESINAVTVGATNNDYSQKQLPAYRLEPVMRNYPALYSCFGGGYGRSIKPDCIFMGGRSFYNVLGTDNMPARLRYCYKTETSGPGLRVAIPSDGLTGEGYSHGTSDAAALTSRLCAELLKTLRHIPGLNMPPEFEGTALKAMLIHCCSWKEIGKDLMDNYVPDEPRKKRYNALKWIGYGYPDVNISTICTDQRATLIGYGKLTQGMKTDVRFPLPDCLISQVVNKRLTITLAWMSPISPRNRNYKLAKLSFTPENLKDVASTRTDADSKASIRGTVQHEVIEGKKLLSTNKALT